MLDVTTEGTADMVGHEWEIEDQSWLPSDDWRQTDDGTEQEVKQSVVSKDGDMVTLRQQFMEVGKPVTFVFEGVPLVAVKRTNGEVDFYTVPQR